MKSNSKNDILNYNISLEVQKIKKKDKIFKLFMELSEKKDNKGLTAQEIAEKANISRSNASRYLNKLLKEDKIVKSNGRPVIYKTKNKASNEVINTKINSLEDVIGAQSSLKIPVQQAKAAILYPPKGLHTLLLGETGVGKSMFAKLMYNFAANERVIESDAPFIQFNCADYADNPQLLMGQLFGVKKGAYTGADKDKIGLLKKADGGIIFLDEVHRLPPQGQEMLFTFIDNGFFKPLGETNQKIFAELKIIAATTETPGSYLLKTFQRRIPMVIELPPLEARTLMERYKLIDEFIKNEVQRVNKDIYIYKNALKSFLLYDCPNNIGQLKSDIQLACAKAFLNYKAQETKKCDILKIGQEELPYHVKKGIMNLPEKREEINDLIADKGNLISFTTDQTQKINNFKKDKLDSGEEYYFYDNIEEKINSLEKSGMKREEISEILNIDIEKHFQKYIGNITKNFKKSKINKIVGENIVTIIEQILTLARNRLNRDYDEKIYYGLALHLKRSIARIKDGEEIYHPQLNEIRINYPQEFITAMEIASIIDKEFNIETPLDEIGYLTMFLTERPYNFNGEDKINKVGIIVIMHGSSTASSIAEVANNLIGEKHAVSINMPLEMNPQEVYHKAKSEAQKLDNGSGIVLMVDMGSLNTFAEMINNETGIKTKTITMASTPQVLEACRKAVLGESIEDIIRSVNKISAESYQQDFDIRPEKSVTTRKEYQKKFAIITACFTGDGAAVEIKEILEKEIESSLEIKFINLNLLEEKEFEKNIEKLKKDFKIISIITNINNKIDSIPSFSASEILIDDGIEKIKKLVENEEMYYKIKKSINKYLKQLESFEIIEDIRTIIKEIKENLNKSIDSGVEIGILLHMVYMIDNLMAGGRTVKFDNLGEYKKENRLKFREIKSIIKKLEEKYNIQITEDEYAYILEMFKNN